jgi:hypothetical protein
VLAARIWDDVLVLSVPALQWSTLQLPGVPKPLAAARGDGVSGSGEGGVRDAAPALSQADACGLARHGHGICAIAAGEVIIYGGYAARAEKLGRTSDGGFAPNRAYLLRHSTPAAAAAANAMIAEQQAASEDANGVEDGARGSNQLPQPESAADFVTSGTPTTMAATSADEAPDVAPSATAASNDTAACASLGDDALRLPLDRLPTREDTEPDNDALYASMQATDVHAIIHVREQRSNQRPHRSSLPRCL